MERSARVPRPVHPGRLAQRPQDQVQPTNYADAALAINEGSTAPDYAAGPQWAIFDAEAVEREKWNLEPPATDPEYFFSADTLAELGGG